jgi:hypothetical protein
MTWLSNLKLTVISHTKEAGKRKTPILLYIPPEALDWFVIIYKENPPPPNPPNRPIHGTKREEEQEQETKASTPK